MKNKQLIKAMYVLVFIFSICPCITFAKTKSPRSAPGTAIFVMSYIPAVSLESKEVKYNDKFLKLNITIPQLVGERDNQFIKNFNQDMLRSAKTHKQKMIELSKSCNKDLKKDNLNHISFEYHENFSTVETIRPYSTLVFFRYQYSGGAHGISDINYLTLDLENGKIIKLSDFFNSKVDYKSVLDQLIKKQISKSDKDKDFFHENSEVCLIKDDHPFFFDVDGNLNIVFNVYEIAPYSSGIIYFKIPSNELLPYMK